MPTADSAAIAITDIRISAWALSTATAIGTMIVTVMIVAVGTIAIAMSIETIERIDLAWRRSSMAATDAIRCSVGRLMQTSTAERSPRRGSARHRHRRRQCACRPAEAAWCKCAG
ncbi:MAG: hypothetical protein CVU18_21285 [Betaproteobacteria bacterium HGW-Betaproteobacteria-12]|nr:MAG: hypothetical protein CVU18_21285 [Betaproteobacteria bacterium HGW-Betaproteobacteria-12]